ncbi:hypothetical protein GQ55_4G214900 [Panicum hallii var. hallii]|uniref:Uncharacterized protein n=1 Tax=Panicum hallii var. hallii TaxID=1504633 RepID=A0A2T7DZB3_9POAL|nr:hypothetical protein GQ55_4G214900 [Panicum hallii var. hallii]
MEGYAAAAASRRGSAHALRTPARPLPQKGTATSTWARCAASARTQSAALTGSRTGATAPRRPAWWPASRPATIVRSAPAPLPSPTNAAPQRGALPRAPAEGGGRRAAFLGDDDAACGGFFADLQPPLLPCRPFAEAPAPRALQAWPGR